MSQNVFTAPSIILTLKKHNIVQQKGDVKKIHGSTFSFPLCGRTPAYCTVLYCSSATDLKLSLELKQL